MARSLLWVNGLLVALPVACGGAPGAAPPPETPVTWGALEESASQAGAGDDGGSAGGSDPDGSHDGDADTGSPGDSGAVEPDDPGCVPSERVECYPTDVGPAALLEWADRGVLSPGKVLVFPFSHGEATDGEQYGRIAIVGATAADTQGYDLRMWFSSLPAGPPFTGEVCADLGMEDTVVRWNQNKDVSGYCRLPDEAGRVYFNYALCIGAEDDFECADEDATFAPEDYRFHIAGTTIEY